MKLSNENTRIQAYVLIILIIGLLMSLLAMIWLNIPNSSPKKQSDISSEVDYEYKSNLDLSESSELKKLQGDFTSLPKPNSVVTFKTESEDFEVYIPSDYRSELQYKNVEIQAIFIEYSNSKPRYQLMALSDKTDNENILWNSRIKSKPRIRSSQWYLFSDISDS